LKISLIPFPYTYLLSPELEEIIEIESSIKKIQDSIDLMQSQLSGDKELDLLILKSIIKKEEQITRNQDRLALKEKLMVEKNKESIKTLGLFSY
jgi:cell division protein YceG involved in septum cleavage